MNRKSKVGYSYFTDAASSGSRDGDAVLFALEMVRGLASPVKEEMFIRHLLPELGICSTCDTKPYSQAA